MICSISGEPTSEPVLSLKSKRIFDRRLITEYLTQNGKDPITLEPMTEQDLVSIDDSVNSNVVVTRKSNQDSIPSMLAMFQNEWDSLSLELFELRKQVSELKKELSLSLYRQDAAVKVATRAMMERDDARKALEDLAMKIGSGDVGDEEEVEAKPDEKTGEEATEDKPEELEDDSPGLPAEYTEMITQQQKELFAKHKSQKHKLPFSADAQLVFTKQDEPEGDLPRSGYKALSRNGQMLAVIYEDNTGEIFHVESGVLKQLSEFKVPKRSHVVSMNWLNSKTSALLLSLKGKIISISAEDGKKTDFIKYKESICGVAVHPSLPLVTVFKPHSYVIYDETKRVYESPKLGDITGGAIHGDGVLMAVSHSDSSVSIMDQVHSKELLLIKPPSETSAFTCLKFAPNGYWLLIQYGINRVGVYDLRKGRFQSLIEFPAAAAGGIQIDPASRLLFLGQWCAIYDKKSKKWADPLQVVTEPAEEAAVTLEITAKNDQTYSGIVFSANDVCVGQIGVK